MQGYPPQEEQEREKEQANPEQTQADRQFHENEGKLERKQQASAHFIVPLMAPYTLGTPVYSLDKNPRA